MTDGLADALGADTVEQFDSHAAAVRAGVHRLFLDRVDLCSGTGALVSTQRPLGDPEWWPSCPECGGMFVAYDPPFVRVPPHRPVEP